LADLAQFGYWVVLYDQLGCGKSELPSDAARFPKSVFTVDDYVEEVEEMRRALGLGRMHLMGGSWGGMLGIAYALKYHENLTSLIVSDGLASVPQCVAEMERLKCELPSAVQEVLRKYELVNDYENPEYLRAVEKFYKSYLCRLDPWPQELIYSVEHTSKPVYNTMWGPNEFTCRGTLKDWDVSQELAKISVPCLITVGKYGEITPKVAEDMHHRIRGSKLVVFENSAHAALWEERDRYISVLHQFLKETDLEQHRAAVV
jgi:proline iminopeptidase